MSVEKTFASKQFPKLLYLGLLLLAFTVVYFFTFNARVSTLGDNASYYILGKALYEGAGYVDITKISHSPNNHYPPGYPAIISIIMLFSSSILVIKLVNGLFFLLSLWVLFELVTRLSHNRNLAFTVTFLCLLNTHLLYFASIMVSEVPFLLFSSLSLLAFTKADFDHLSWKDPSLLISLLCLVISYYIRSMGIALLFGYLLHFLIYRRWKAMAVFCTGFIAAALPWFLRGHKLGGSSYMKQLMMVDPYKPELGQAGFFHFAERMITNLSRYLTREIPNAIFPAWEPDYHAPLTGSEWLLGIFILCLVAYGIYSLPGYRWVITGYVLATLGILLVWPEVWIGVRFIAPIIPFLVLGFFSGCYALLTKSLHILKPEINIHPLWLLVAVLVYLNPLAALHKRSKAPYSPSWKSYFEVAAWLKKNKSENVVVGTAKPALFYLHSGSYVMRYKFAGDPAALIADLEQNGVHYVVIDQVHKNTRRYLLPLTEQYPERFKEVYRVPNTETYLLKFMNK